MSVWARAPTPRPGAPHAPLHPPPEPRHSPPKPPSGGARHDPSRRLERVRPRARERRSSASIYPDGIHAAIAAALAADERHRRLHRHPRPARARPARRPPEGHRRPALVGPQGPRRQVDDATVDRVAQRVHEGMGLIVLHSGHFSKIFKRLMGTPCSLRWREAGERERLWAVNRSHPITRSALGDRIELPSEEMYGEPFLVPEPLETVLISWFEGGEVFRSGLTYQRGAGRIFYFRPGHETYPTYHDADRSSRSSATPSTGPTTPPPPGTTSPRPRTSPSTAPPRRSPAKGAVPAQARRGGLPVSRDRHPAPARSSAPAPSPATTPSFFVAPPRLRDCRRRRYQRRARPRLRRHPRHPARLRQPRRGDRLGAASTPPSTPPPTPIPQGRQR